MQHSKIARSTSAVGHSRRRPAVAGSRPCPETPKTGRSVEERAVSSIGRWPTAKTPHGITSTVSLTKRRSIQARAALVEPGVSQQAFELETGVWVGGVMPAYVTPISKIPIDSTGSGD